MVLPTRRRITARVAEANIEPTLYHHITICECPHAHAVKIFFLTDPAVQRINCITSALGSAVQLTIERGLVVLRLKRGPASVGGFPRWVVIIGVKVDDLDYGRRDLSIYKNKQMKRWC